LGSIKDIIISSSHNVFISNYKKINTKLRNAQASNMYISQSLETTDVIKLQGKTMTVSFQYKIPTNFTSSWAVAASW
jgi:hypothetical protein